MSAASQPHDEIAIIRGGDDRWATSPPVEWAIGRLRAALEAERTPVRLLERSTSDEMGARLIVAGAEHVSARPVLDAAGVAIPRDPEALGLIPGRVDEGRELLVTGSDVRGLVYAVLELADRVEHGDDPLEAIRLDEPVVERPANPVRSVARLFVSELHDRPWFRDEGFWRRYLSMVVAQRFNRVNLMVGLGYNFPWRVADPYLYFAYPFLVDVPGSGVRVPQLPDEERERNLAMLRFISDEAVARGLDFQFGMWTHAFEWLESEDAPYTIEGLDPERHATYCGEAIQMLLGACPSIGGLTIRTHGESGVPERSWDFWKVVFDGIVRSGRTVGLDLHAKGLDEETLDLALETGLPVTLSPKFSAEHMGLPYHQAAMRELDRPPTGRDHEQAGKASFMNVSEGSRPFTRYSYGDFLRDDRPYDVVFRIWPGTQRVLLWGDPAMAAGFGRNVGIAGSEGLEWCEPLSLEGREGTAMPGPRDGYADATLSTADDWEQHAYTFRLFGRLLYDPDASPDGWRRYLRSTLGSAAQPAESALASASRILPLVTSAHHPSASNNYYWPEIYTDVAIVDEGRSIETHYYDTPEPKRFGTVGPLDPEVFLTAEESARELETGIHDGRYSALDVARWLERLASDAKSHLAAIEGASSGTSADVRRWVADVAIQAALGRFFAGKLRAGVAYERYRVSGEPGRLLPALTAYRSARSAWAEAAAGAAGVYLPDLTYGPQPWLRGNWGDRLAAIEDDLGALELIAPPAADRSADGRDGAGRSLPPLSRVSHDPPSTFTPSEDLRIVLGASDPLVVGTALRYRRVNQAEPYVEVEMEAVDGGFAATIPADYAEADYPLQYHFVVRAGDGRAWLHPGLGADLSEQPYHVSRPVPLM